MEETADTKFACAVFTSLVVYHKFSYIVVSCIFRKIGNVTVHISVHLDAFDYLVTVGFQSAVEIVQIFYSRNKAGSGIEKFCWDSFAQRVVTLLLVTRNKVVSLFGNHTIEDRNLVGTILKVGVHCNNGLA